MLECMVCAYVREDNRRDLALIAPAYMCTVHYEIFDVC